MAQARSGDHAIKPTIRQCEFVYGPGWVLEFDVTTVDDGIRTFYEPAGARMLEIIDKGLTTRAHETPLLFVHGGHHAAWCWNEREPRRSAKSCLLTHVGIIGISVVWCPSTAANEVRWSREIVSPHFEPDLVVSGEVPTAPFYPVLARGPSQTLHLECEKTIALPLGSLRILRSTRAALEAEKLYRATESP